MIRKWQKPHRSELDRSHHTLSNYRNHVAGPGSVGNILLLAMLLLPVKAATQEEAPLLSVQLTPPDMVERQELLREEDRPPVEERKPVNIYTGFRFVSKYMARGLVFSNEPSFQPWVELDIPLVQIDDETSFVNTVTAFMGNWNNVNLAGTEDGLGRTGRAARLKDWFEADLYAGIRLHLFEHMSASLRYNYYSSPSGAFRDIHELDLRLSYNDAPLWESGHFGLYPSLRVTRELRNLGRRERWYFQPSLAPTWNVQKLPLPVTLQVPLILGFGADGQYRDAEGDERHFGFFQTGFKVAADLDLLPQPYGSLMFSLGFDFLVLAEEGLGRQGDGTETVIHGGVAYTF